MQTPKLKSGVKDLQNLKGLNHRVQESDWVESLDLNCVMMISGWKDWSADFIHVEALWQRCDYATDSVSFDDGTSDSLNLTKKGKELTCLGFRKFSEDKVVCTIWLWPLKRAYRKWTKWLSQRRLGLLQGRPGKNRPPITDQCDPSNNPRDNCGELFG